MHLSRGGDRSTQFLRVALLAFNDVVRVYNDEGVVRAAAQAAIDEADRCP